MREIVFDIETEKEFKEVGGKENMHLLGVAVVGVYDYATDTFHAYEREEFAKLESVLKGASAVIGFNSNHFDIPVLAPHVTIDVLTLPSLDLMEDIERFLGFRVSLDNLAQITLNKRKSGVGLEALQWWRNGEKEKVKEYCLQDVRLTRELYEFGKKHGFVLTQTRDRGVVKVPVNWNAPIVSPRKILEEAFEKRLAVEIDYSLDGKSAPTKRRIDIHRLKGDAFEGFCHASNNIRTFRIAQVSSVLVTDEQYQLHDDVQQALI